MPTRSLWGVRRASDLCARLSILDSTTSSARRWGPMEPLPGAANEAFGACRQQPHPNHHAWTVRAHLQNLVAWIKDGVEPPPSGRPPIAAGALVAPDQVHCPPIPANRYGGVSRPAVRF